MWATVSPVLPRGAACKQRFPAKPTRVACIPHRNPCPALPCPVVGSPVDHFVPCLHPVAAAAAWTWSNEVKKGVDEEEEGGVTEFEDGEKKRSHVKSITHANAGRK